jgi:DNA topoisomerase-3
VFKKTKATFNVGGETYYAHGATALKPGFTAIMPWKVRAGKSMR